MQHYRKPLGHRIFLLEFPQFFATIGQPTNMLSAFKPLFVVLFFSILFTQTSSVYAQSPDGEYKTFTDGDVSFRLPNGWRAANKSTDKQVQQINVVPDKGNALIMVSVYTKTVESDEVFLELKEQISKPRQGIIAQRFESFTEKADCVRFGEKLIPGASLSGPYKGIQSTSSSYSVIEKGKFVHILYIRENNIQHLLNDGWKMILSSITVKGDSSKTALSLLDTESDEFINGKAITLPKPLSVGALPSGIRSITVPVRITIDANGDVIRAKALTTHLIQGASAVEAAKKAKFKPGSICGEFREYSGRIFYIFTSR